MALALAAGIALGFLFTSRTPSAVPDINATILDPPKSIEAFKLIDHRGEPFVLDSLRGKWSFVFFGYTHCPDVCPTTLHTLSEMDRILAERSPQRHDVQIVFVSVDPERDSAEQLAGYVPYFNRSFIGVTGAPEEIDRLTRQLGILHLKVDRGEGKGYLVDHSASILLFDPSARLRGVFSAPHRAERMATDFIKIREIS